MGTALLVVAILAAPGARAEPTPETGNADGVEIFTIGHSRHKLSDFARLLRQHRIQTLVDVRSQPVSRRAPWACRGKLEGSMAEMGVGYRFLGDRLGGRPDSRRYFDDRNRVNYDLLSGSPQFKSGLRELIGAARGQRVAIMCACGKPDRCHRNRLISPRLSAKGVRVCHILTDGTTRPFAPRRRGTLGFSRPMKKFRPTKP